MMTPEIATCLIILGLAVIAFAWDRIPANVVALGVMLGNLGRRDRRLPTVEFLARRGGGSNQPNSSDVTANVRPIGSAGGAP
jgi:hypothetical protein